MSVDDSWVEALRKSAEQVTPGDKTEYQLKTRITEMPAIELGTPEGSVKVFAYDVDGNVETVTQTYDGGRVVTQTFEYVDGDLSTITETVVEP